MLAIAASAWATAAIPHQTITIVDPAAAAIGTGGMEYPTFITAGTIARLSQLAVQCVYTPEKVVAHEFGQQFWQGLVASNEFEEAWLDEGIT